MGKLLNIFLLILSVFFPKLKKAIHEDAKGIKIFQINRNSKCYCNSGKKYKRCHLLINRADDKMALRLVRSDKSETIVVYDKETALQFLGEKTEIKVINTFSETEVGSASQSINR